MKHMIAEYKAIIDLFGGLKIVMDTRGDRMVYLPMSEIEKLKGAYTS